MLWIHRVLSLFAAALVAGCTPSSGGVCALSHDVLGPAIPRTPALVTDARGHAVFWSNQACACNPGAPGVFGRRDGGAAVTLSGDPASSVSALAVSEGFLVCWTGSDTGSTGTSCAVVDGDLRVVDAPRTPEVGGVFGLGRIGGEPFALVSAENFGAALAPISETGRPRGDTIPLPKGYGPTQFTDRGLVRLESNPPGCDSGTTEAGDPVPASCVSDVSVYGPGGRTFYAPNVAPSSFFGRAQLAARGDRFLITWNDAADHSLALVVKGDGSLTTPQAYPSYARPFVVDDGFVVVWNEHVADEGGDYELLRGVRVDEDGQGLGGPAWLLATGGRFHANSVASLTIGGASGDFGMAWITERGVVNENVDQEAAFRRVTCLDEEAPGAP